MSGSLLRGKRFYCREWAFAKLSHCLENRATSKTCGVLVTGGPGSGKTALCCELVWPTESRALAARLLAYHFCEAHDAQTLSPLAFVQRLATQLSQAMPEDVTDPEEAFRRAVLFPLLEAEPPPRPRFLLVDSVDQARGIAELLAAHHHMFPRWLLLVVSARRHSKSVTRLFTGFRKVALDDLRKSHAVRDVQQYILCRLDREEALRQHLSRDTAEMLNQLHIKSNGCFLYLEVVLDGVAERSLLLREVRDIPGTLNGLYLWLCQRLFPRGHFARVRPLLDTLLAARAPLDEEALYQCCWTRDVTIDPDEFRVRLALLQRLLVTREDGARLLFHHSFAEWLLDVKHCTQKYLCDAAAGHAAIALRYTAMPPPLSPEARDDFAMHLSKAPGLRPEHLALWLALCDLPPRGEEQQKQTDPLEALLASGADLDRADGAHQRTLLHSAAHDGADALVRRLLEKGAQLECVDKSGQTPLNLAARQGYATTVELLLKAGTNTDHADNDGWTPLRSSAWAGHTEVVKVLLENGAQVDLCDTDGRTALRAAAWGGHEEIVSRLLLHGACVNQIDNEGRTALIAAAYMGHTEIVQQLLDHGAEINHEDSDGRTALSVAALCVPASEGHARVVSLLLERGAEVDHQDKDGMTPLLVAAFEGHSEVCELLLENEADVDHTDNNGRTPLVAAASMGHPTVVSLLLFWGAAVDTIDAEGRTVLSIAAAQGNPDTVRQLLDRGLDEMHRDNGGWTPLHYAAFEGHTEACELLLEAGAKITEVDNDGRIPLILAAQEGHTELVHRLLEHTPSMVDHRAHDGKTALRIAALEGHKDTVLLLLNEGADLNYKDADGRSTLYLLALEDRVDMAAFLLDRGADVEARDLEGRTALHVSAWQGHSRTVDLLLERGAAVDAVDNDRRTALQSAAWQGHAAVVRLLLERGATVDHVCNQGATALCIAAQEGHLDAVRALLERGADPTHADQFGRNPTRVAAKGGHTEVVRLLEEYGDTASTASTRACSAVLCQQESPPPPDEKRRSFISNQSSSKSSSNSTTNRSSKETVSFTQQLQQCGRKLLLSPLSEPPDDGEPKTRRNGIVTNPNYIAKNKSSLALPFKKETHL